MQVCKGCGESKPLDAFYMGRRGRPRGKCKECCKASWPKSGKRTAQQRADYRRRTGQTTVEYRPTAVRMAEAAAKRAAEESKCDVHVKRWRRAQAHRKPPQVRGCLHDAHVQLYKSPKVRWARKYASDPKFAASERLRNQLKKKAKLYPKLGDLMRSSLNRGGRSKVVEKVCGYTIAELAAHLESLFTEGMSWEAFLDGEIHIDHIRPQSSFDLMKEDDVRACWSLGNLQPLWWWDNLAKRDRLDWLPAMATAPLRAGHGSGWQAGSSSSIESGRELRTAMFP